ncbi:MAG: hypothetical protein EXR28_13105 [Betaproteobacteria bacterium]|nr:hypothetical protein [Betaproteobacteria bacterium]
MASIKPDYADELEHWLRFDRWYPDQAFALFSEDDPDNQGTGLGGAQLEFDRAEVKKKRKRLEQIWWSNNDPEQREAFPLLNVASNCPAFPQTPDPH